MNKKSICGTQRIKIVFRGDMCGTKNTSREACVRPVGVREAECKKIKGHPRKAMDIL